MAQCVAVLKESRRAKKGDLLYDETCRLGSGRLGTVYRATLQGDSESGSGEVLAVKEIFHVFDEAARVRLEKNILSWATFGHANVNLFRAFHEEEGKVLLVYAHLPGETLAAYLGKDPLTDARRVELATETAQGLLYLHTRDPPMWHGNVHPGNIVIGVKGNPILTDYGIYTTADQANGVGLTKTDDRCRYNSPEVLTRSSRPTTRSDVWSWSCVFLKITTGKSPYDFVSEADSVEEQVRQNMLPATVETLQCSVRVQNIMGHCWKHDSKLRPPMRDVLSVLTGRAFRFERAVDIPMTKGGQVGALGFSPDGLLIAVALSHVVQFFSTDTWKVALELALPVQCHMPCIRFSPSGSLFALGLGNVNYVVWVWDLRSGTLQKTFSGMTYTVSGVDISRDDSLIAASSLAGEVRLWRLGDEEAKVLSEPSETDIAYTVTILSEGDLVAAGFREGGVRIWDVQTGSLVATLESPASAPVMCTQLSPDGCWLFSSGSEVIPWDVRTIRTKGFHSVENSIPHLNTRRLRAPGPISPVSISPDNVWMAAIAANSGNVHVVQPENPESARSSIGQVPAQGIRRHLALGPVSNRAAGLVAGYGGGGGATVYKYASWDFPGAYLV